MLILAACSGSDGTATATVPTTRTPETTIAAATTSSTTPPATIPPETTTTSTTTTTASPFPLDTRPADTLTRLENDLAVLIATGVRTAGSPEEIGTGDWLADQILAITGTAAFVEDVPLPDGLTSVNVWSTPTGNGTPVLLGAHIDSVPGSPGLDDNGSGTVVLLEMLRRLVDEPVDGVAVQVVFFGAEEVLAAGGPNDHHFGSRLAAERLASEGTLPEWMLSVDMIGVGNDLVGVAYEGTDPAAAQLLAAAGSNVGTTVITLDRGDISDHEAFARAGSIAAMMWRPDNPAWHTPSDDTVDTALLLDDIAVLEAFLTLIPDS